MCSPSCGTTSPSQQRTEHRGFVQAMDTVGSRVSRSLRSGHSIIRLVRLILGMAATSHTPFLIVFLCDLSATFSIPSPPTSSLMASTMATTFARTKTSLSTVASMRWWWWCASYSQRPGRGSFERRYMVVLCDNSGTIRWF